MVTGGQELILGGRQDPNFGPVVLIGLGGIFVEVFEEVALRVAPLTRLEASEMIDELRGASILKGARGHKPSDIDCSHRSPFAPVAALDRLPRDNRAGHQPAAYIPGE